MTVERQTKPNLNQVSNMSEGKKNKLFDSDDEESCDDFKIRPHYQGPHGHQILEINSQLPKRFKLDERFEEDFEPIAEEDDKLHSEENDEKKKNIRILETLLGHEVGVKCSDKNSLMKKQIRFDPDDENASKFIKNPDAVSEKPKKSKKRKRMVEEKVEQNIPLSTERYTEVCSDLKEILNTASPFSFSQRFSCDVEKNHQTELSAKSTNKMKVPKKRMKNEEQIDTRVNQQSTVFFTPKLKYETFFITEGDPRLKEGIEFFKQPKNLEEIKIMWHKRREHVLEVFKQKRRSSQRSRPTRVQNTQIKNKLRRTNFKK